MEMAYVGLEVSDRPAFDAFLGDIVGLVPGSSVSPGVSSWRNDERIYRIQVSDGPADDVTFIGIELEPAEFSRVVDRIEASGLEVTQGSQEDLAARGVSRLVRVTAPWGGPLELVTGLEAAPGHWMPPLVPGGFLTAGRGFGHIVLVVRDENELQAAHHFLVDLVGFRQSDWFEAKGEFTAIARFYHCNPRHHSIALACVSGIGRERMLNHIMLETVSEENVGTAFDRAWLGGVEIANGLGRHDNDRMFSFYMVSPAGINIEFGYGAREVSEPWNEDRCYDRQSVWGHLPLGRRPAAIGASRPPEA